eukprot:GHVU01140211.1.p1 GENE.GHVU01140211.1~~GHVU01140211.1.p1  ORF type:complete len:399 (-),score=7.44 GHVU01140211.1:80-1276(-)
MRTGEALRDATTGNAPGSSRVAETYTEIIPHGDFLFPRNLVSIMQSQPEDVWVEMGKKMTGFSNDKESGGPSAVAEPSRPPGGDVSPSPISVAGRQGAPTVNERPIRAPAPAQPRVRSVGVRHDGPIAGAQPSRPVVVALPSNPVAAAQPSKQAAVGPPRPLAAGGKPSRPAAGGPPNRPTSGAQPTRPARGGAGMAARDAPESKEKAASNQSEKARGNAKAPSGRPANTTETAKGIVKPPSNGGAETPKNVLVRNVSEPLSSLILTKERLARNIRPASRADPGKGLYNPDVGHPMSGGRCISMERGRCVSVERGRYPVAWGGAGLRPQLVTHPPIALSYRHHVVLPPSLFSSEANKLFFPFVFSTMCVRSVWYIPLPRGLSSIPSDSRFPRSLPFFF